MKSHTDQNRIPRPSLAFWLALSRMNGQLNRRMDGKLGAFHGLSFVDFGILSELAVHPHGRLRRVDLAERLGLTQSAVTRLLLPLEKIGLLTRQLDDRDARIAYAAITAAGRRIFREALETAESLADDLCKVQSAELGTLHQTLSRITGKES